MPQRNRPRALNEQQQQHHHHQQQQVNSRHHHQQGRDPLAACLDADGTYICTAYNSRCYIIQKVTPNLCAASLNPDADIFQSKVKHPHVQSYQIFETDYTALEGSVYMNGDVGKLPSGAVYAATPETLAPSPNADFSSIINGVGDPTESLVSEGGAAPMGQAPAPLPPESSIPLPLDPNNPSMPIDQLKQMLSSQLEYYFSRENLANDAYLISQMDNDQYVPIWTVANFNQVKKLTTDIKLITEVLRESPNVQVDEEGQKVRPNHKRCIVILREIPDSTPLEEVKALFSGKGCPKLISCEFAHNNSWYVTFENDEDAQRAYRFLREEVKEFQGKPIMARIKAKPMSRLPMPPVTPGMGGMKNGYRTPPATAAAAAATATVYDPASAAAFPPGQQRFLYTNGTSLPPNVNYTNQVQIYTFQQHQPFYPPSMLPHWGATTPTYFDIGSVFSVNGLAPQGTFGKGHNTRFIPRNRNKRSSGLEQRASLSDSSLMRGSHTSHSVGPKPSGKIDSSGGGNSSTKSLYYSGADRGTREVVAHPTTQSPDASSCGGAGVATEGAVAAPLQPPPGPTSTRPQPSTTITPHDQDDLYGRTTAIAATTAQSSSSLVSSTKESLPPRRRRKEDDVQCRGGGSPGPQFDLEADAFPPLPVLEPAAQPLHLHHHNYQQPSASAVSVSGPGHSNQTVTKPLPLETPTTTTEPIPAQSATQWVESRLSDVVKGTAKMKMGSGIKDKDLVAVGGGNNTVSSSHGGPPTPSLPTPPNTPDKIVPGAANGKSSSTPSKLTKTDDTTAAAVVPVMNGSGEPAPTITASSTVVSGSNGIDNLRGESVVPVGGVPSDGAKQLPANVLLSSTATTGVELPSTLNSNNSSTTPLQSQSELAAGVVRLSYAQVAQHHHKEKAEREKQQQSTVVSMAAVMSPAPATLHNMAPIALPEEEKKEITIHHTSKVVDSLSTRGRGGAARAAPRRRDNLPRFNSRQRSPK